MKKTSLRRLLPQDFDADLLKQLTREGRVYICMPKVEDKSAYKQEIMDYVQAISEFVAEAWKGQIGTLWNDIVNAACMSDFSVMLRQSYDGSKFDREAKSVDAVNVHIDHLLWNVVMCGTPDALYRVVSNYTDGFQSRIAVARTPDNTFAPLEEKPHVLTDRQKDRIQQIAHLLPLMQGEVVLPRLEAKGRAWLEKIRLETMKNDDRTKARQRIRVCVTA